MPVALQRYLICLGMLSAIMAVYCATVVPLLQPPPRDLTPIAHTTEAQSIDSWWQGLFPAESWQNGTPMVLQTEQGTLLFKTMERIEAGNTEKAGSLLLLKPLTLIVPMGSEAKGLALGDIQAASKAYHNSPLAVVVANEGAEILFKEPPDFTNVKTKPQLVGGTLKGLIEIAGIDPRKVNASGGPTTDWLIRTSHVRIEGRRVWTNNEVEILSSNSQASGQGLSILLKQNLLAPGPDADGPWGLLQELELHSLRQVDVRLPPGGLWKGLHLGSEDVARAHDLIPARLQLFCKRNFTFYFDQCRGVLTDHVRMEHRFDGEDAFDEFKCHELKVEFTMPSPGAPVAADAIMVGPMQLKEIDALGIDWPGPVVPQSTVAIDAPNISTKLDAKRLQVLVNDRRFIVHSQNGRSTQGSRAAQGSVFMSYLGNEFHAHSLEYRAAPKDEHLGWLVADGPGYVSTARDSEVGHVTARWKQNLKMAPNDKGQLIQLIGSGLIESTEHGHLYGDQIDVQLSPDPIATAMQKAAINTQPNAQASFLSSGNRNYQVESVTANGQVDLGKPSQEVKVKQLHLKFIYPEKETAASMLVASNPNLPAAMLDLTTSAGTAPTQQFVSPPGQALGTPASTGNAKPLKSPPPLALPIHLPADSTQPMTAPNLFGANATAPGDSGNTMPILVIGNQLYSQIIVTSRQSWIDKLQITGHVVISRAGPPQPDALPWRVDGDELLLNSDAENKFIMQVAGQPARASFGDGWIAGPVISLNQRTGLAWIDRPGTLSLPSNLMHSKSPSTAPTQDNRGSLPLVGSNVQWLEPVKVSWQDRMLFNGTSAHMAGNIAITGNARTGDNRIVLVKGNCDGLEVRLSRPVDVGSPGQTSATVQNITLQNNVIIQESQLDASGTPLSLERISVPELTYEPATNRIIGKGSGTIHSQHYASGQGGIGALASGNSGSGINGAGNSNLGMSGPTNMSLPNSSAVLRSGRSSSIQALNLRFRDQMEAQLDSRIVTFLGKVEVGLSPVNSLDEMLHLNEMRTLKLNQSLVSGDLLRISDTSDMARSTPGNPISGAWELEAQGNVIFESKSESGDLFGKAYRVTYFQAKDLLLIKGDTRIAAEVRLRPESHPTVGLAIVSLWSGSINLKTLEAGASSNNLAGAGGAGGEGQLQLAGSTHVIPRGSPLAGDTWKSIVPGAADAAAAPAPGATPAKPATPATRPRDSLQEFFK